MGKNISAYQQIFCYVWFVMLQTFITTRSSELEAREVKRSKERLSLYQEFKEKSGKTGFLERFKKDHPDLKDIDKCHPKE